MYHKVFKSSCPKHIICYHITTILYTAGLLFLCEGIEFQEVGGRFGKKCTICELYDQRRRPEETQETDTFGKR